MGNLLEASTAVATRCGEKAAFPGVSPGPAASQLLPQALVSSCSKRPAGGALASSSVGIFGSGVLSRGDSAPSSCRGRRCCWKAQGRVRSLHPTGKAPAKGWPFLPAGRSCERRWPQRGGGRRLGCHPLPGQGKPLGLLGLELEPGRPGRQELNRERVKTLQRSTFRRLDRRAPDFSVLGFLRNKEKSVF